MARGAIELEHLFARDWSFRLTRSFRDFLLLLPLNYADEDGCKQQNYQHNEPARGRMECHDDPPDQSRPPIKHWSI